MFVKKDENLPFVRKGIAVYTFICNDCYRRDEYSNHYKFSHMENDEFIGRCPSFPSGCPFYYHKKKPKWGSLRSDEFIRWAKNAKLERWTLDDSWRSDSANSLRRMSMSSNGKSEEGEIVQ